MTQEPDSFRQTMDLLSDPVCVCGHAEEMHYNDGGDYTSHVACEDTDSDGRLCPCQDYTDADDPQLYIQAAPFPAEGETL